MCAADVQCDDPICSISPMSNRTWLRTNGVNNNVAAAEVMDFDRLGKRVRPGTFGKIQVGKREYPKDPSVNKHEICSDRNSADPICPFPSYDLNNVLTQSDKQLCVEPYSHAGSQTCSRTGMRSSTGIGTYMLALHILRNHCTIIPSNSLFNVSMYKHMLLR